MRLETFASGGRLGLRRSIGVAALLGALALSGMAQNEPVPVSRTEAVPAPKRERVAVEYVVGPSDVLDINVWKEPELSQAQLAVRPDGMISMPLIGVIKVGGLTPSQIQDLLTEKLHRYLAIAQVTVTVAEVKSKFVYITGEVGKPGVYPLVAPTDVLQLIIKAGGLTPFAKSRGIVILRASEGRQLKLPVNYKKLLQGEYPEQNIALLPGDTVVVP